MNESSPSENEATPNSIFRLAHELGASVTALHDLADRLHIPVARAVDPITDTQADDLRLLHGLTGGVFPEPRKSQTPSPFVTEHAPEDPQEAAIRRNLGIRSRDNATGGPRAFGRRSTLSHDARRQPRPVRDSTSLKLNHPSPAPRPSSKLEQIAAEAPTVVLTVFGTAIMRQWPGSYEPHANAMGSKWDAAGISVEEATAWWQNGLPLSGIETALACRRNGIRPEHLSVSIRGDTILTRIVEGRMSLPRVRELLQREGHDRSQ